MPLDPNQLIQTQVTHQQVPVVDDGQGNYNISPVAFPVRDNSGANNPTLLVPNFDIIREVKTTISTNITPLSGLHGYLENQLVILTAQTVSTENGSYYVHAGEWDKKVSYVYDGTENDNVEGSYPDGADHYRKGYSHGEVSDFLREKLSTSINFGKVGGPLHRWFSTTDSVNIGGSGSDKTVFIDPFAYGSSDRGSVASYGPVDPSNSASASSPLVNERKMAQWMISNHHTEVDSVQFKSPYVRDYPFAINSPYKSTPNSGGFDYDSAYYAESYPLDSWRIGLSGISTPDLRPFCSESLYYQRENGYHNNITLDATDVNMLGRQHVSILHHLDTTDSAATPLTSYVKYRGDLLKAELDLVANQTLADGQMIIVSDTQGTVTKYYYKERVNGSISSISPHSGGGWSATNLLWAAGSGTVLNIYVSATAYVPFTPPTGMSSAVAISALTSDCQLIPVPFTIPSNPIDRAAFLSTLNVLFVYNSIVDQSISANQSDKIRSKKTFIHLPSPITLMDGQQFELDVSLPMVSEQRAFPFSTLGSLSGYMNYVSQPRAYVLGGMWKQYSGSVDFPMKVNSLTASGATATLTSDGHGIADSTCTISVTGSSNGAFNGTFTAVNVNANTLTYTMYSPVSGSAAGAIEVSRVINVGNLVVASLTASAGTATLTTTTEHGLLVSSSPSAKLTLSGSSSSYFNGTFVMTVTAPKVMTFAVSLSAPSLASGSPYIISGSFVTTPGNHIDGLTERSNNYLFSAMPEVEYATQTNMCHQRRMNTSDFVATDNRVLLASVYPTSINTFAWRMDNDPQVKLMKWSVMSLYSTVGSAAYMGYMANRSSYEKVKPWMGSTTMGLSDSSISYETSLYTGSPFDSFIAARTRVQFPSTLIPSDTSAAGDIGSLTIQARKAFIESMDAFESTRVGFVNFSDGLVHGFGNVSLGYDDNGSHAGDTTLATGFDNGILRFNTFAVPNPSATKQERWITKAIYTPAAVVNATGNTEILVDDDYNGVSSVFKTYLAGNLLNQSYDVNGGTRYVDDHLNPTTDPSYPFGIGNSNNIYKFLKKSFSGAIIANDFALQMADWYSPIPNVPSSGLYGDTRDFWTRFHLSGSTSATSMCNFWQMTWTPFAKIFSTDNIIPTEWILNNTTDYSTILGSASMYATFVLACGSNPILLKYLNSGFNEAFASVNTQNSSLATQEYIRNYVAGYANRLPLREYNSFRVGVIGGTLATASTDPHCIRIYDYSLRDYTNQYIGTLPDSNYAKYIDDNFYLRNSTEYGSSVVAYDANDSHVYFNGTGISSVGLISITDNTQWLVGGNASFSVNGYVITASLSISDSAHFIVGGTSLATATNIVNLINSVVSSDLTNIHASNYGGYSTTIRLTVSESVGSVGNSYTLSYTPASSGHIAATVTGFTGGIDANTSNLHTKIDVSGQSFIANRDFYESTMRFSYIRVHMRMVFSESAGRWLTTDYRQCPTSYLTPSVGNQAYSYKAKSLVSPSGEYIPVTASQVSSFTNKDYLWEVPACFDPNKSFVDLWCTPYSAMNPLDMRRSCLPFLTSTFPYDDNGNLESALVSGLDSSSVSPYLMAGLSTPVSSISFITPADVNGSSITPRTSLNAFQPNLWDFYWHIRPATSAMSGCDIPSPTTRTGGVPSNPTLHNMFAFPPMINSASSPNYMIPWSVDMSKNWLLHVTPTTYDAAIVGGDNTRSSFTVIDSASRSGNSYDANR